MALKVLFEGTLRDREDPSRAVDLEFGYASRAPEKLVFLRIRGQTFTLDEAAGRELLGKMSQLALHMGWSG